MKNCNAFSMDNVVDDYMAIYHRALRSAKGAMPPDRGVREELRLAELRRMKVDCKQHKQLFTALFAARHTNLDSFCALATCSSAGVAS
jgi:hypothetical protein